VGVLDAGEGGDALGSALDEIGHREGDAGDGGEVIEVEREPGGGGGDGGAEVDQFASAFGLEEPGGEGGDGRGAAGLGGGGEGPDLGEAGVADVDDHRELAWGLLDPAIRELDALCGREGGAFAGGAADEGGADATLEQELDLEGDGVQVERAVRVERRVGGRDESGESERTHGLAILRVLPQAHKRGARRRRGRL
jgi:hypothetical protein